MNIADTLFSLEKFLNLELDSLLPFASEDHIGGFHPDPLQRKWDIGGIWEVEGQILYALVRAFKPVVVMEIGSGKGCSTTHIATALQANGNGAHLTTFDRGNTPQIAADLQPLVTMRGYDALEWLTAQPDGSVDFIFEDADHSEALCKAVGDLAKTKLAPGGLLMSHDAVHFAVGRDVTAGYNAAGIDYRAYLCEPSDCGFLVWQQKEVGIIGEYAFMKEPVLQAQEDESGHESGSQVEEAINVLTDALHDDISSQEKLKNFRPTTDLVSDGNYPEELTRVEPQPAKVKQTRKPKRSKQS